MEHFWLYNDRSDDHWQEILQPYIQKELVEVKDWPATPHFSRFTHAQAHAYADAIKNAMGKTKWLALIDTDEFLLPMEESTVTECLNNYFNEASAVYLEWLLFGTNHCSIQKENPILFHLTACAKDHLDNTIGKSIVRPECVDLKVSLDLPGRIYIHHFPLASGQYYNGDGETMEGFSSNYELLLDRYQHKSLIYINHYTLRDESFFYTTKLPRAQALEVYDRVQSLYQELNVDSDKTITDFIQTKHPESYQKLWAPHLLK